jgi:hypothetical protein
VSAVPPSVVEPVITQTSQTLVGFEVPWDNRAATRGSTCQIVSLRGVPAGTWPPSIALALWRDRTIVRTDGE